MKYRGGVLGENTASWRMPLVTTGRRLTNISWTTSAI